MITFLVLFLAACLIAYGFLVEDEFKDDDENNNF